MPKSLWIICDALRIQISPNVHVAGLVTHDSIDRQRVYCLREHVGNFTDDNHRNSKDDAYLFILKLHSSLLPINSCRDFNAEFTVSGTLAAHYYRN